MGLSVTVIGEHSLDARIPGERRLKRRAARNLPPWRYRPWNATDLTAMCQWRPYSL